MRGIGIRTLRRASAGAAIMAAASLASAAQEGAPKPTSSRDGDITEYTRGCAVGLTESSYIHQPQIDTLVQLPNPRVVPIQKLPIDQGSRDRFEPAPRRFASFSGVSHTGWVPPDCTLAVGPNHVLQTVNMKIAWYDKSGSLQFSEHLGSPGNPGFFEGLGAGDFTFDPKCFYDDIDDRFVVVVFEVYGTTQSWIDIAISDDDDPNGTWHKYRTDSVTWSGSSSYWVDYPGFGYDNLAYYVTGNLFGLNTGGFLGAKYRIFDKASVLGGGTAVYFDLLDSGAASVQVAESHNTPFDELLVSTQDSTNLRLQAIRDPVTAPNLVTTSIAVPYYQAPPNSPELGGGSIDTLDGRIMNVEYASGYVVAGHGIAENSGGKSLARWYEIQTNNWPAPGATPALAQSGNVDLGGDVYTFFPGIARRATGEIALTMAYASVDEYAGIATAVHLATDPAGEVSLVERAKTGSGSASGRWGDYFDCCLDPSSSTTYWGVGEYPNWTTWLAEFDETWDAPTTGFLYSTRSDATVGSIAFRRGDVVHLDPATGIHSLYFDGSDVYVTSPDLDGLCLLSDGSILMSFRGDSINVPGLTGGPNGTIVEDEDVIQFFPATLGENTTGSFVFYFDGSDVGLDVPDEDIDGLTIDAAGNLWMTFVGPWNVGGGLTGKDEDVVQFTPTSLGSATAGTWSMILDGTDADVKLGQASEDVRALHHDPATATITLATAGDFRVPVNVIGENRDLFEFTYTALGSDPAGSFLFHFDGDAYGLADDSIDALHRID